MVMLRVAFNQVNLIERNSLDAVQMEALKRYRTGGQQRVIVEHVTVNAGGQAIVGSVTRGGKGQT